MRQCLNCRGTGVREYDPSLKCRSCGGHGYFLPPDEAAIRAAIFSPRKKGQLVSRRPQDPRAYFVWRLARFHGGADVTMPVMAYCDVFGDPYQEELEKLADRVAREVYGTDLAAMARWAPLLFKL